MEIIIIVIIVFWIIGKFADSSESNYSYDNSSTSYPSNPTLSIRKSQDEREGRWYVVKLRGFFPFKVDGSYNFVYSLLDTTDGDDNAHPAFTFVPQLQEDDNMAFQFVNEGVYIPAYGGWEDYTQAFQIPVDLLSLAKKGKRRLTLILRIYPQYVNTFDINFGFGGESAIFHLTKDFTFDYQNPGYEEISENKENIVKYSIELAISMANIDGNYDNQEKEIIKEWITQNSKTFNEDLKEWQHDSELIEIFEEAYEHALQEIVNQNLPISEILNNLKQIADTKSKHDAIDLCYKVLAADGNMDREESNLIKFIADELEIQQEELLAMQDQYIISMSITEKSHTEEDINSILGITNEMSRGEKIHKLKEDFSKWNSRLNVVSSQEEKDNAQAMIDLISKELTKLR